jgi:hypothetical protein
VGAGGVPIIFAVSTRRSVAGVDHLGIKADSEDELTAMRTALEARGLAGVEQRGAECCYARADKLWVHDPNGVPWELYAGTGSIEVFGDDTRPPATEPCGAADAGTPVLLSLGSRRP